MDEYVTKWHIELGIFIKIKPLIILEGNVLDSYQYPVDGSTPKGSILHLSDYLHYYLKDEGYENLVFYDSLGGFYNHCEEDYLRKFGELTQTTVDNGGISAPFKGNGTSSAASIVQRSLCQNQIPTAIIMNYASRYITSPEQMEQSEVDSFNLLLQSSIYAQEVRTESFGTLKNLLILIVNKVNDLPTWFYLQNPNVKMMTVSYPTKEERDSLIKGRNFPTFFAGSVYMEEKEYFQTHPDELSKIQDKFVALTDGFSFTELNGLRRLCKNEGFSMKNLCDVVDLYKYGIKENPWKALPVDLIRDGEKIFKKRVKGQENAIIKTLDVIKRAVAGMSGLQGSSPTRPKGVLFFAGPTGTGKTETAKTLAELLFGYETSCIRFDMSEFGQAHSDQKLLGAPPGYVGYEAGGQLTNAIKKNPFSILLFDEIEKAHPSILDKFLQILEDGRMTDGQGNTVYFSEAIIIFTSNLGMYTLNTQGQREANVTLDTPFSEMERAIRTAIEDYFKLELGRPEILNRIGENIVTFDFIRPDVAEDILMAQLENVKSHLFEEKNITINISESVKHTLLGESIKNLSNGGRGIGNVVEHLFINPLARFLFDEGISNGGDIRVEALDTQSFPPELQCVVG